MSRRKASPTRRKTGASKDAVVTREPARADKQINVDRVQEANGGPIETEVATPGRESYVRLALVCLQGGSLGDEPAQPPSPHRHVPEEVALHAARRPTLECALSDGTPLRQPLDVMAIAATTTLSILHRWVQLAARRRPLRAAEKADLRSEARVLAASAILLDDLAPRMSEHVTPFGGPEKVAGILSRTWHAWCADAARQVLWRAFPRSAFFGSGTITALLPFFAGAGIEELRATWLGEIKLEDLRRVRERVLGEFTAAWRRVEESRKPRATTADIERVYTKSGRLRKAPRELLKALATPIGTFKGISKKAGLDDNNVRQFSKPMQRLGLIEVDQDGRWVRTTRGEAALSPTHRSDDAM